MKEFAKIFNTKDYGQILVTCDSRENEEGDLVPSINFFFIINDDFGICEMSMKGKDKDTAWTMFDDQFDKLTEDKAIDAIKSTVDNFNN